VAKDKTAAAEVRDMDDETLLRSLTETKEELFNLRFQLVTGQLDNHIRIRHVKRHIARLATELRAREIAAAEALQSRENA
jgi:large subunit ribosomal protein L29